ncbi:inactive ubiquitin carboxyl-terminal hydrolase 54-like [Xenia sp. Carnegie-2017]|uniref:inactive ubiquitin carboxyl-terminal hydrolase 54-like n=1 Tax=Xenia sp. Carnegie-2017 TaxID=2897299 RepID=UPI001F03401E|nr:inactive ubiquitin carboxyl-terminal hydrolase 54-like [Xenia sp. Carnegie-2017]
MNRTDRLTRKASGALTKGLLNAPGENNCFLNSAVQVLLHLDVFRRSFREISGHYCVGESCIFCALKVIFTQIQYSDEAALPPDALRQALAVTFKDEQRFQLQDMDDAAECLENILNRLHFHFAMNEREEICSAPHCISHRKFAMEIMEQSCCPSCKATSEPLPFSQLVHYVSVSALCHQANISSTKHQDFGTLLQRAVNKGDLRKCPGIKCNKKIGVQQSLLNCPDVVCIGLIWDSENPDLEQITQLLDCIDPVLRLSNVFPLVVDANAKEVELMLVGVVTYYGKHYSTYFKISDLMTWIYFDDAVVKKYGSEWETIREKCFQNHYQPLLLLYVNEHAKPVNTKTAPAEVIMVNSETLLAIQNANRSNEKTQPNNGKTFSVLHETKSDDGAGARLSSSSSHSTISEQDMETEVSSRKWKKDRRPIKLIREFGADIKKAFSRNRNSSPTREHNSVDIKSDVSRDDGENSILPEDNTDSTRDLPRSASNSPTPDGRLTTRSFNGDSRFNAYPESKIKDSSDLMHFTTEDKASTRQSSSSLSMHGRDVEDLDSGLGSSQSSSPATSSVSSVDTNGDDLIDFSTRTQNYSKAKTLNLKINVMIQEGESYLKKSFQVEKRIYLRLCQWLRTQQGVFALPRRQILQAKKFFYTCATNIGFAWKDLVTCIIA